MYLQGINNYTDKLIPPVAAKLTVSEKIASTAVDIICNRTDYVIFAIAGGCLGGWPGFAAGIALCKLIKSQIPPQDNIPLNRDSQPGPCGLKDCRHCS